MLYAAAAPSHGVNASNAATIAQVAIGLLRQQLPDGVRINAVVLPHRAVTNVIQAQASLEIEVRAHDAALQQEIKDKALRACHGGVGQRMRDGLGAVLPRLPCGAAA